MDLTGIVKGVTNRAASSIGLLDRASEEEAQARWQVCLQCPIFDSVNSKCVKAKGGCGCNMKNKIYCLSCKCPKDKW